MLAKAWAKYVERVTTIQALALGVITSEDLDGSPQPPQQDAAERARALIEVTAAETLAAEELPQDVAVAWSTFSRLAVRAADDIGKDRWDQLAADQWAEEVQELLGMAATQRALAEAVAAKDRNQSWESWSHGCSDPLAKARGLVH